MAAPNRENNKVDEMTVEKLKTQLEGLRLLLTDSEVILRERLRGDLEEYHGDLNHEGEHDTDSVQIEAMSKVELVNRLCKAEKEGGGSSSEEGDGDDAAVDRNDKGRESGNVSEATDEEANVPAANQRRCTVKLYPTLSFKNVEDALETFSDDGIQNFGRWLTNSEEAAELCTWTEVQKVIYVK